MLRMFRAARRYGLPRRGRGLRLLRKRTRTLLVQYLFSFFVCFVYFVVFSFIVFFVVIFFTCVKIVTSPSIPGNGIAVSSSDIEEVFRIMKQFHKLFTAILSFVLAAGLAACGSISIQLVTPTSSPLPAATKTSPAAAPTSAETSTVPVPTVTKSTAPVSTQPPDGSQPVYLDDRSTAVGVVLSLFNAINRREYLRAYSYWQDPGTPGSPPSFDQFQQGYQDTASVKVTTGVVSGSAGAGQWYYNVPVVLAATTAGGQVQTYSGCYILHLANPGVQTAPPFHPMGIKSGLLTQAAAGADPAGLLAHACEGNDIPQSPPLNPVPTTDPKDITAANYLDDRSDPQVVLSSMFNAINRKEYARAYSYWQNAGSSANVQPFPQFQQGYQDTASVSLILGEPKGDIGAGQIRSRVPVVLKSQSTSGQAQSFAGCYQLHLSQPAVQGAPPFQPWGIELARVHQVDGTLDPTSLLASACDNMP